MNWNEDSYYQMICRKLSDALHNLTYHEKEYKQALATCQVITKQIEEYQKLVEVKKNDRSTLE